MLRAIRTETQIPISMMMPVVAPSSTATFAARSCATRVESLRCARLPRVSSIEPSRARASRPGTAGSRPTSGPR